MYTVDVGMCTTLHSFAERLVKFVAREWDARRKDRMRIERAKAFFRQAHGNHNHFAVANFKRTWDELVQD
jgi:hypothetical protein